MLPLVGGGATFHPTIQHLAWTSRADRGNKPSGPGSKPSGPGSRQIAQTTLPRQVPQLDRRFPRLGAADSGPRGGGDRRRHPPRTRMRSS
jgi:hypothetical protein